MNLIAYETVNAGDPGECGGCDCLPAEDGGLLLAYENNGLVVLTFRDAKGDYSVLARLDASKPVLYRESDGGAGLLCLVRGRAARFKVYPRPTEEKIDVEDNIFPQAPPVRTVAGTLISGCGGDILRSENDGESWTKSAIPTKKDMRFPHVSLWTKGSGDLCALLSGGRGFIYGADSYDDGKTFGAPYRLNVTCADYGTAVASGKGEDVFLLSNPGRSGGEPTPLALYLSKTGGSTFKKICLPATGAGRFTHPAIRYDSGRIYMLFNRNGGEITLVAAEQ